MLKAFLTNDFSIFTENQTANTPLEPLELSEIERGIIVARLKKLAKDPAYTFANALELVHLSYKSQEWERQKTYDDFNRPRPGDRKAWKQYEEFIELAVQLLSKYRGPKGDWRTDRFATIPTTDRSSIGSSAARRVSESYIKIRWESNKATQQLSESLQSEIDFDSYFQIDANISDGDIQTVIDNLIHFCESNEMIVAEVENSNNMICLYIYDHSAELKDKVFIELKV